MFLDGGVIGGSVRLLEDFSLKVFALWNTIEMVHC